MLLFRLTFNLRVSLKRLAECLSTSMLNPPVCAKARVDWLLDGPRARLQLIIAIFLIFVIIATPRITWLGKPEAIFWTGCAGVRTILAAYERACARPRSWLAAEMAEATHNLRQSEAKRAHGLRTRARHHRSMLLRLPPEVDCQWTWDLCRDHPFARIAAVLIFSCS